jgi:hypothetical protein
MKRTDSNRRRRFGLLRREEGQAAFEFLLILPFFLMFLLLLVDLGMLTYEYVSVANASREAARYGSVNCEGGLCSDAAVQQRARERSSGIVTDISEVEVGWIDIDGANGNSGRGDSVVVKITHPYDFLFFPAVIDVVSCTDMRLERTDGAAGLPDGSGC